VEALGPRDDHDTADDVVPEKRDVGDFAAAKSRLLPRAHRRRQRSIHTLGEERQHEHAQHPAKNNDPPDSRLRSGRPNRVTAGGMLGVFCWRSSPSVWDRTLLLRCAAEKPHFRSRKVPHRVSWYNVIGVSWSSPWPSALHRTLRFRAARVSKPVWPPRKPFHALSVYPSMGKRHHVLRSMRRQVSAQSRFCRIVAGPRSDPFAPRQGRIAGHVRFARDSLACRIGVPVIPGLAMLLCLGARPAARSPQFVLAIFPAIGGFFLVTAVAGG